MAAKLDLVERVSYISSTANKNKDVDGDYTHVATPDVEGGALRAGETPELFSKQSFGLLAQYAAVGLIYGTLPSTVYPFLTTYLNMEGTATTSATALLSIPWSLKVFIGMLSDNFPIFGYRRRPFMMIGWSVCALCLFVMAFMPMPKPYFIQPEYRKLTVEELVDGVTVNESAPDSGAKYIVLMMLASLGYVFADVAADAVVVEYAQREPEAVRGRTQTAIYATRTTFMIISNAILAFGMNGKEYGGDWNKGMSFANVMLLLAIFSLPVIAMTWFFVHEERYAKPDFKQYINTLWEAIQTRAFYQVIAFNFFFNLFANQSYVASSPIQIYWVEASNLNYNLSNIIGNLVFVVMLAVTGKFGLHWNWRYIIGTTAIIIVAIDAVFSQVVVWDVFRNQWFWLGAPIVENVPYAVQFIVSTYIVVELAGHGNEGACYGLLTTVSNLSQPFAATVTKLINGGFDVWNKDIMADTKHVRTQVTYTIMIAYACKIFALAFLVLLPPQKAAAQELKRNGGSSKIMGIVTISYCMFALVWSIMTNLLAIFESTKCLSITGGCHN
ncbi:hypothetical protein Poli38472_002979 [Pythium oligandrum]|uniref:Folate-Biopterin Transporter (FBT) Family n=1 Tax=Pythium oligandrum TaxID=41045 RepID=A0A8K1C5Q1_PYTOL|nr:hypothetical protein Poli38472_002979 [Pythium oligandrum]|eukprot:TMW57054.1 hypothetical protein Poli38472_002979 [Pythium oligandrum]